MYHLKLTQGRSYDNGFVRATADKPDVYVDDEAIANMAVASGHFELVNHQEAVTEHIPFDGQDEVEVQEESTPKPKNNKQRRTKS